MPAGSLVNGKSGPFRAIRDRLNDSLSDREFLLGAKKPPYEADYHFERELTSLCVHK